MVATFVLCKIKSGKSSHYLSTDFFNSLGQQMSKTGIPEALHDRLRDGRPVAGHEGRRNGTRFAADHGPDPE